MELFYSLLICLSFSEPSISNRGQPSFIVQPGWMGNMKGNGAVIQQFFDRIAFGLQFIACFPGFLSSPFSVMVPICCLCNLLETFSMTMQLVEPTPTTHHSHWYRRWHRVLGRPLEGLGYRSVQIHRALNFRGHLDSRINEWETELPLDCHQVWY